MPQPPDLRPHPTVNYPGQGPSLPGPNTGIDPLDAPYQPVWQKDKPGGYPGLDANGNVPASELGNAPSGTPAVGSITTAMLAPGAADGPALGPDVVTTGTNLVGDVTGPVGATAIAAGAVNTGKMAAGAATGVALGSDVAKINAVSGKLSPVSQAQQILATTDLTDVTLTSPADGDLLVYKASAAKWQNYQRPDRTFEFFGGSKTGTLAAQTAAFNAFRTWADANGGGILVFGAGTYQHMPRMELGDHEGIWGQGFFATRLQFDATITTGALVFNHVSTNGTTDANAYACSVDNLAMDASLLPGWSTNAVDGVVWNRNPQFGGGATADSSEMATDAFHRVRNVFIWNTPRDGADSLSMGEQTWENIRVYSPGRYGFQPPFDSAVVNCCVGFSHAEGLFITGQPTKLVGCKAFASGNGGTGVNGAGFHIKSGPVILVGCEAQDNYGPGVFIDTCGVLPVAIDGGIMDSNSKGTSGGQPAIDILSSTAVRISGVVCQERRVDGVNSRQVNAVSLRTNSIASISLVHVAVGGATIGSPFKQIDSGCFTTILDVNQFMGMQPISYSASYTPNFFDFCGTQTITLTGNIVINAPGNGPYPQGARATLILKQDATGGRTITWNGIYVNTPASNTGANAYTVANLKFDGTSWIGGA